MATTNALKIGLTSGTATAQEYPSKEPVPINQNQYIDVIETQSGDRIFNAVKKKKQDYSLIFRNKTESVYNALKAFCDVPIAYYVILQNPSQTTQIADGYYFLRLASENVNVDTDTYRYNFTIEIIST